MPRRACLVCGALTSGSYCPRHRKRNGSTRRWRELRVRALIRAGSRCERCGSRDKLHAHHLVPVEAGGRDQLRNLQVLCEGCHKSEHTPSPTAA
jgi:5-methylcytosine-specific restriction endonuclease McrA